MTLKEVLETKATGLIPKFRAWFDSEMYDKPIVCDGDLYLDYSDFLNGDTCNDAIIMKSTGKFDNSTPKNEIFEGDIVEVEHELTGHRSRYIITFESVWDTDNEFYFWSMREPCFNNVKPISYLYLASERVTVLGNIYENPELLEIPEKTVSIGIKIKEVEDEN